MNRFYGSRDRGVRPRRLFRRGPAGARLRGVRGLRRRARSGASAMRAIAPPLSPIPRSTVPSSAATTRSIWPAASPLPVIPGSGWSSGQRLYLFSREVSRDAFAADPGASCGGEPALAGAGAGVGAVAVPGIPGVSQMRARSSDATSNDVYPAAAEGSPQAMNSGTIKPGCPSRPWRPPPNRKSAPRASVTLPPAAVTTACPAATSHSDVGARRG